MSRVASPDDRSLVALVGAVEAKTGDAFFRSLVGRLASALKVEYSFVSELTQGGTHFRTRALWKRDQLGENFEIPVAGTPCEAVRPTTRINSKRSSPANSSQAGAS
jgi:hypothetical protein